jgi:putative endopeptidase
MKWTLLRGSAGPLSTEIENAWDFYGKTLTGAVKQDQQMAFGSSKRKIRDFREVYVAKKFPPEAKAKARSYDR